MVKGVSKKVASREVDDFFRDLTGKTPLEVKRIKRLAMESNVSLRTKKRLFCKKCFSVFNSRNSKMRIKNGFRRVSCENCDYVSRWKFI